MPASFSSALVTITNSSLCHTQIEPHEEHMKQTFCSLPLLQDCSFINTSGAKKAVAHWWYNVTLLSIVQYIMAIRNQCFLTKTHWFFCPLTPMGNNVSLNQSRPGFRLKTDISWMSVRPWPTRDVVESMFGIPHAPFITTAYGFKKKRFKSLILFETTILL